MICKLVSCPAGPNHGSHNLALTAPCRLLVSLGWALFSIFPSYLMLHYCMFGNAGLRIACNLSKFLMMVTGLGAQYAVSGKGFDSSHVNQA